MTPKKHEHVFFPMMRFRWPLGLLFPDVEQCLVCGVRK